MTVQLAPPLVFQSILSSGAPNAFGTVATYIAGTATPQATWPDSTQGTPNQNPVPLNAFGQASIWLATNFVYKIIVFDALGNQIGFQDQVAGGVFASPIGTSIIPTPTNTLTLGNATNSWANVYVGDDNAPIFDPVSGNVGYYDQTAAEIAAGVTPTNFSYFAQPWLWVRREGCVLDGSTDDSTAFNKCLSVASTNNMALLIDGSCYLNSTITIPQNVQLLFAGNGKIKPGSGKTVTVGQVPQAGLWQIFDLSAGGLIALPGYRSCEVWGEWWGANGDGVTNLANDVPINAAIAAVNATAVGGTVRLGLGTFFCSAVINLLNLVSLRGMGFYTLIKPKSGWAGGTKLISATNGTSPMFESRLEYMRVDGGAQSTLTQMVYGTGWQQRCGLFFVTLQDFQGTGFYYEHGYGGAAFMEVSHVDIFPNDVASAIGMFITNDATTGFMKLMLSQVSVANGGANTQNVTGIQIDNQIIAVINAFDIETITQGITLTKGAVLTGAGMSGGTSVTQMIECAASWTGKIDLGSVKLGNATAIVNDVNRAYAIAAVDTIDSHLTWPPSQTRVVAGADILVSAGVASYGYQQGFSVGTGPNRTGAGSTTLTLATSMDGTTTYDVVATSLDSTAPQIAINKLSATTFAVKTFTGAGVAQDAAEFSVKVYHHP